MLGNSTGYSIGRDWLWPIDLLTIANIVRRFFLNLIFGAVCVYANYIVVRLFDNFVLERRKKAEPYWDSAPVLDAEISIGLRLGFDLFRKSLLVPARQGCAPVSEFEIGNAVDALVMHYALIPFAERQIAEMRVAMNCRHFH